MESKQDFLLYRINLVYDFGRNDMAEIQAGSAQPKRDRRKLRGAFLGRRVGRRSQYPALRHLALGLLVGISTLGISGVVLGNRGFRAQATQVNQGTSLQAIAPQPKHHSSRANQARLSQRMAELRQGQQKWLEINVATQRLIAWEGGKPVYAIVVSTGKSSTPTYPGIFSIYRKQHPERMRGRGYDIPNVPHAMYYHRGYAIHGAYWHRRFGTPVSRGCTNVAPNHARWLYNWATVGTPVVVHRS